MNMKRIAIYLAGIVILALGLTMNTKTGLGSSPIIAVAYALASIFDRNLGDVTFVVYCVFVAVQIAILIYSGKEKKNLLISVLQLPFSIVFTRFMKLFSDLIPYVGEKNMVIRIAVLLIAIIMTGAGAAMILDVKLIANPADGIVACLADLFKKETGLVKNCFDIGCIMLASLICLIFSHPLTGVGIGSVVAMLLTGRVMSLFNRYFKDKIQETL